MDSIKPIDDVEIQQKVESLVGKGTRVVDCEKSTRFETQEILLVNGFPVPLSGEEGLRIKKALMTGQVPPCELLSEILIRAGILKTPVELETTMNVKSTTKTTELLTLKDKNGMVVDERVKEVEEDNEYKSSSKEVWRRENEGRSGTSVDVEGIDKTFERLKLPSEDEVKFENLTEPSDEVPTTSTSTTTTTTPPDTCDDKHQQRDCSSSASYCPAPSPSCSHHNNASPKSSSGIESMLSCCEDSKSMLSSCSSPAQLLLTSSGGTESPSPSAELPLSSEEASVGSSASTYLKMEAENMWGNKLVYQEKNLVAGTLDGLIEHLAPAEAHMPDGAFIFAFLLSSRLHIRPHELFGRVLRISLKHHHQNESMRVVARKEANVTPKLVQLLGEWAELFPYDFRDEQMMVHVRAITQRCVSADQQIRKQVSQLLSRLLGRLTALERYEDYLHRNNIDATLGDPYTTPSILVTCSSPAILAQQLTHIELERLSYIGPEEFVQAFAKDSSNVGTDYQDMKKTRNLECYVQWFNRLSFFVATEICKVNKKKGRIRVVEYWIEVARECFNIGNFNSLMAIIAGLNMSPVARLKRTWAKVSNAQLSVLEHQMDPTSNFSSYRSTLTAAIWRSIGATDERQKIVIPFFSLLVKDLYFLNEGCASKLPNGYINFEKFWQFSKQVSEVKTWQQIVCSFPKVESVISCLNAAPVFSENTLGMASFECESPDGSQEKERLKCLRREEIPPEIEMTDCIPRSKHFRRSITKKSHNGSMSSANGGD